VSFKVSFTNQLIEQRQQMVQQLQKTQSLIALKRK
jgi:hypothetical protein